MLSLVEERFHETSLRKSKAKRYLFSSLVNVIFLLSSLVFRFFYFFLLRLVLSLSSLSSGTLTFFILFVAQTVAGCRIHRLHLCRGVRPPTNESPGYDTKQSDGEVPVMLGLWEMGSTPSLPLLPGPLCPRVVAPDRALSMG